jgi:hypothetical protein
MQKNKVLRGVCSLFFFLFLFETVIPPLYVRATDHWAPRHVFFCDWLLGKGKARAARCPVAALSIAFSASIACWWCDSYCFFSSFSLSFVRRPRLL